MPRIAMPGPWAYAAGGLTGGLGEGLMLGMQARKQRESEEQAKQARAMQLLMGFQKIAAQDPEAAKAVEPQIAAAWTQMTGKPWTAPAFPTAQEKMQRIMQNIKAWQAQGLSLPESMAMEGITPPKQEKPVGPTFMRDPNDPTKLIPLPTGAKITGGYPPAWQGDPWSKVHWGYDDQGNLVPVTPSNVPAGVKGKPPKEPKEKTAKERNYESYMSTIQWIEQNIKDPAEKQKRLNEARKRAVGMGILSPGAAGYAEED